MTYEEALNQGIKMTDEYARNDLERYLLRKEEPIPKSVALGMKALERQIPKEPRVIDQWRLCPTCYDNYGFSYDILVGMRGLKTGECHCLNCGQAILLGEDDDETINR